MGEGFYPEDMKAFSGDMRPVRALFIILTIISLLLGVIFLPWFAFQFRAFTQPIRARPFAIVFSSQALLVILMVDVCLTRIWHDTWPCVVTLLFIHALVILVMNLYLLRVWLLWFSFKSTQEKNHVGSSTLSRVHPVEDAWYLSHKHYAESKFLLILFAIVCFLEILSVLIAYIENSPNANDVSDTCQSIYYASIVFNVFIVLTAFVAVTSSCKFGPVKDGFWIKRELRGCGITTIVGVFMWALFSFLDVNYKVFPFSSLFLYFTVLTVFCISTVYPLYLAVIEVEGRRKTTEGVQVAEPPPLVEVLSNPRGLEMFREHVIEEFSVENLMFYQACRTFSVECKNMGYEVKNQKADAIYHRYINEQAPLQVNIKGDMVEQIDKRLREGGCALDGVFDSSSGYIFNIMQKDTYPRFLAKYASKLTLPAQRVGAMS